METTNEAPSNSNTLPDCCYNFSTGYLEDALIEFSVRFKRQRLLGPQNSISASSFDSSDFNLWTEGCSQKTNLQCFSAESESMEEVMISLPNKAPSANSPGHTQDSIGICLSTESSSVKLSYKQELEMRRQRRRRRRRRSRVAYPFATVKPGGVEGDLTLDDINKRIKMAPSRAVRHPVGDYACHPCVVSPHGPGLSGKTVVALTRIHTQGSGTITIIRTKG